MLLSNVVVPDVRHTPLPPPGLLRCLAALTNLRHSESADLLCKSLLPHVRAGPKPKCLICLQNKAFLAFDPGITCMISNNQLSAH